MTEKMMGGQPLIQNRLMKAYIEVGGDNILVLYTGSMVVTGNT
jgi:hypothetical protein